MALPKDHLIKEVFCICGHIIKGKGEGTMRFNLKVHKRGARHKVAMEIKRTFSGMPSIAAPSEEVTLK